MLCVTIPPNVNSKSLELRSVLVLRRRIRLFFFEKSEEGGTQKKSLGWTIRPIQVNLT
jgi:hypothetical protein